jgi:hypothetical protein
VRRRLADEKNSDTIKKLGLFFHAGLDTLAVMVLL